MQAIHETLERKNLFYSNSNVSQEGGAQAMPVRQPPAIPCK